MKFGKLNIVLGSIMLLAGGIGGFMLGGTLESAITEGAYAIPFARIFTRGGHTHGMLFAYYNLIIGLLVDRLNLSDGLKRTTSLLAALAMLMSAGLLLRGLTGGAMTFAPVGMLGGLFFIASAVLLLAGALRIKTG